jgi:hypothetical protein
LLQYYITNTSVPLELVVLSGGTTVTGLSPVVQIRHKDLGQYFDWASRTFTGTTTSATGVLLSAKDGFYRLAWDVSGLFTTNTFLTFEYHQATALSIEDILFTRTPLSTGDAGRGMAGSVVVKGGWSGEEKKDLVDRLKDIQNDLTDFRRKSLILLRDILNKKQLQKEDLDFIYDIRKRDVQMWQEMLKILNLRDSATESEVYDKLQKYMVEEEVAKQRVLEKLNEVLKKPKDNGDDD